MSKKQKTTHGDGLDGGGDADDDGKMHGECRSWGTVPSMPSLPRVVTMEHGIQSGRCIIPTPKDVKGRDRTVIWTGEGIYGKCSGEWVAWNLDGSVYAKMRGRPVKLGPERDLLTLTQFTFPSDEEEGDPAKVWNMWSSKVLEIDHVGLWGMELYAVQKATYRPISEALEDAYVAKVRSEASGHRGLNGIQLDFDIRGTVMYQAFYFGGRKCGYFTKTENGTKELYLYDDETLKEVSNKIGRAVFEALFKFQKGNFPHPSKITFPDASACPFKIESDGKIVY